MLLKELDLEQIQTALKAGSPDEIKAHLASEGIELPFKAPWDLPDEIAKFGMKLWQTVNVKPRELCTDEEHDFKLTGKCEMVRNAATMPGSCFSREQRCTKCAATKWVVDKEPEPAVADAGGAEGEMDERAARRAARKAAREAKAEAAE